MNDPDDCDPDNLTRDEIASLRRLLRPMPTAPGIVLAREDENPDEQLFYHDRWTRGFMAGIPLGMFLCYLIVRAFWTPH